MIQRLVHGRNQKLTSLVLLALFISLGIHVHEHDPLGHFHFHKLTLSVMNQASLNLMTDGYMCPCLLAMLAMPAINGLFEASLNETNLAGFFYLHRPLSLTWEIFHPPQAI